MLLERNGKFLFKRSHTQPDPRKQVTAFQDRVATKCFDRKQDDKGFKMLDKKVDNLDTKNKLIRMADKPVAGWSIVDKYLTDELASDSDDEKRMRHAEARVLRKKKDKLESYNRAKCSTSTMLFKTSVQTTSVNAFPKRTGQTKKKFLSLI